MKETDSTSQNPNRSLQKSSGSTLCEECGRNPPKYNCPGCSLRTCSLPCVKSHKQRTSCTGKRPRTTCVPLSQFDDNLLLSDYNFLEEAKRVAESARRVRYGLCQFWNSKLPPRLKLLRDAARRRKTTVLILSSGMSRREINQSRYDLKTKSIFWTIEWRFLSSDVVLLDHRVDENKSLISVFEEHVKPGPGNRKLKPFSKEQFNSLKFFIRKTPKGPKSPFRVLNIEASLIQQLSGVVIIEYPVIHVSLPSHSYDFEIEESTVALNKQIVSAKPFIEDPPSPKAVHFTEEEIDDSDMPSDTQYLDLMTYMNHEPPADFQIVGKEVTPAEKKISEGAQYFKNNAAHACHLLEAGHYPHSDSKALGLTDDVAFDFGQDLQDAYSHLIGLANPDDYLCLEDGFFEDRVGKSGDQSVMHVLSSSGEELEEGEIVEF